MRSAAVPAKLGFAHEATLGRRTKPGDGAYRDTMIWTPFAHEYPNSTAAAADIKAFDAIRRTIEL